MIVVMRNRATENEIKAVMLRLENIGYRVQLIHGVERIIIGAIGEKTLGDIGLEAMPSVERVIPILQPYKLASRNFQEEGTVVRVGGLEIGGDTIHVIAGPCAVENREQLLEAASLARNSGATMLRGGAFKPRTSPYSFQGLEEDGLKLLAEAREATGLLIVTEVMEVSTLPLVAEYADILQIGARNMQNFSLLREIAKVDKPVVLKRGLSATIEEWLMAAEYVIAGGNYNVILCERGIRSFDSQTRNTLDLTAVPVIKHLSHLPIIVDPSHATGKWRYVPAMAKAAIAAGADGLMIEMHPNPAEALSDGAQSLTPGNFIELMSELQKLAFFMGRKMS